MRLSRGPNVFSRTLSSVRKKSTVETTTQSRLALHDAQQIVNAERRLVVPCYGPMTKLVVTFVFAICEHVQESGLLAL